MKSLRSKLSMKSRWYISKYRYLELKNMCLQYPEWKKELQFDNGLYSNGIIRVSGDQIEFKDSVFDLTERRSEINRKIKLIEDVAKISSGDLSAYILECIFFGKSYEVLQPPCGRRQFYEKYREFFWMLDKVIS